MNPETNWLGPIPCDGVKPDWVPDDAIVMVAFNPRTSQNAMTWEFAGKRKALAKDRDWENATAFCIEAALNTRIEATANVEPVAWREDDAGKWIYHDADSDLGRHIAKYQQSHHGKTLFPLYAHPSARITDDKDRGNSVEGVHTTQALLQEARELLEDAGTLSVRIHTQDWDDQRRALLAKLDAALGGA